jgi:hypothetical protein
MAEAPSCLREKAKQRRGVATTIAHQHDSATMALLALAEEFGAKGVAQFAVHADGAT